MHKVTKHTSIPKWVKETVSARDDGMCVLCYRPGLPNAHVVRRSQLGRGDDPRNIVCLCPECHDKFDKGKAQEREAAYVRIVAHLKGFYPDWSREDMMYRKGDA